MTDSTPVIQQFLEEVHRRSIWQVIGLYLGTSWGILEVISELIDRLILPESVFKAAIILLAVGLPIMVATAYYENHRAHPASEPKPRRRGLRRFFTWRNALLGGVAAFALLGLVSAAFLASRALGIGFAAPLIARGVLEDRQAILLTDFDNRTSDSLLARAVTEALRVDLAQSSALRLVDPQDVRATLERMQQDPNTALGEERAREVASRLGVEALLVGAVDRLGAGYAVSARLVAAESGEDLIALRETAADAGAVIEAVDRLSRKLRARIGESLGSVNASPPLPEVTTGSLAALKRFAAGSQALRGGDRASAIALLESAVRLDTTFAAAYRGLGIAHGNNGDLVNADRYSALARRYSERLPLHERYLTEAAYHAARGRRDSVAHYYGLLLDLDPEHVVALNNLADTYEWMGRYEDALRLYRRVAALDPDRSVIRINLASAARTLGMHELADSAVAAMEAAGELSGNTVPQRLANALYAQRDAELEKLIVQSARDTAHWVRTLRHAGRATLLTKRGRPTAALASADSAAVVAEETGNMTGALIVRLTAMGAATAAGTPAATLPLVQDWDVASAPFPLSMALGLSASAYAWAGRYDDAERLLARADSVARAARFHQPGAVANARAVLALRRGRPAAALEQIDRAIAANFGLVRLEDRLVRAFALEALGRHGEAAQEWTTLTSPERTFWLDVMTFPAVLPLAHERAGHAYLATGDTARALRHLGAFTELWANAEPALQPRVRAATSAITAIQRGRD